jgi:hypothetical protein
MKNKFSLNIITFTSIILMFSCSKKDDIINEPYNNYEKTYGGIQDDAARSFIIENKFLYVFGTTKSLGDINGDHYLIKLDLGGNIIYEKSFGGAAEEEGVEIIATNDGNFLLVGSTQSSGAGLKDIHVIKVDADGNQIWENTFGGAMNDAPNDVIETSTGEFCITGITESYGAGMRDIYLVWVDQNGNMVRQSYHGGSDIDGGTKLIEIENQELMIFGFTRNYGATSRDFYLLKTNSIGDSLWSQRYGGTGYEESQGFSRTQSGGFLLNGHSSSTDPNHNMYGLKLDINGNQIWDKNFGGAMHDGGMALLINKEGNYLFVGRTMSNGNGMRDMMLVITNPDGQELITRYYGGSQDDWIDDVIEYEDYYYFVGHSNSFSAGDNDVYLIKQHK